MSKKVGRWYHYSGAIHIHTTESDGTKPIEEVIAIGQDAGLDFMMFSDHMNLRNREAGHEGIYDQTLVVVGYEHNDRDDKNHFLVFNSPSVYDKRMTAAEYVRAARADRSLGITAHPIEKRSKDGKLPPYPWLEWEVTQFDGLELWNQLSEWTEQLTKYNKLAMVFSPRKSMIGPPPEVLKIWDDLSKKRKYLGIAGVDAHALAVKVGPLKLEIFPYKVHFKCIRTHLIMDEPMSTDFETARDQLYRALASCRVFCSNMRWGIADDFQFSASNGIETAVSGDSLAGFKNAVIKVSLPSKATIKLIANGTVIVETISDRLEYTVTESGLYRVEAWKGKRGWIFSNHIRIGMTPVDGLTTDISY